MPSLRCHERSRGRGGKADRGMTGPRTTDTPIRPVILAGGSGTRLWPASRASFPKQFTTLISEESLFQSAVLRLTGKGYAAPLVITTEPFRFVALEQMENIGITPAEVASLTLGDLHLSDKEPNVKASNSFPKSLVGFTLLIVVN